ncbi:AAA domain-containing protein [Thiorhodococcus mannitoliphagus]|uniref:AAA domain-containing protein n=1 Tax=Thiorhodococcus mannitoliphagus TaxID=329406 RepID=A0A6P1E042_9GAMM|nr:AAA family ATPase [Thiorhodococcus mannitoliphagus]NEX21354.1 AAA domain-containing protein [Thiorhodococcus mannitoliphagus]
MNLAQRRSQTETPSRAALADTILDNAGRVILGKDHELRLALACLLARGHLLIEDLPGVGKTTLAHLLARLLGLDYSRIQFTSDLLPADVIGVSVYDRATEGFRFHPGPIFSQLILADEINRATPKAQSALLEAMEERQVTVEGETRPLPEPFFVIATQNPLHQVGTYPLPESQLDRFLMRIQLGYPEAEQEKRLLAGEDRRDMVARQAPALTNAQLIELQRSVALIHAAPPIIDYVHAVLQFTRGSERFAYGLSPRAGLGMLHAAKAWAFLAGRDYAIPEDVQAVLPACVLHRLVSGELGQRDGAEDAASFILDSIPV